MNAAHTMGSGLIRARFVEVPDSLPAALMVFPAGVHTISATRDGKPIQSTVLVDADTAATLQQGLRQLSSSEQKPFFDFDHDNTAASAWPKRYYWESGPGIPPGVYCEVEWTSAGAAAIAGRQYRSFSPAFFTDGGNPARVTGAPLHETRSLRLTQKTKGPQQCGPVSSLPHE